MFKKKRRVLAIILTLAMVIGMMPVSTKKTNAETLYDDIHISHNKTYSDRLIIEGSVRMYIDKGVTVTAEKGIQVTYGNDFSVEGEGKLIATGSAGAAGIGATNLNAGFGDIYIEGCTVEATGGTSVNSNKTGYGAAGIGGADSIMMNKPFGSVTIDGGKVTAIGGGKKGDGGCTTGLGGAGIGGGNGGLGGEININGGEIEATGGSCAAAIGSGNDPRSGYVPITINGGTIVAHGNIGGSGWHNSDYREEVSIFINGGNITADSMGGGSDRGDAYIGFNWTIDTYDTTKIISKFSHLKDPEFLKAYIEENDPFNYPVKPADLTKYDMSMTLIPYHHISIQMDGWEEGKFNTETDLPKVSFLPTSASSDITGIDYEIYNSNGDLVASFTDTIITPEAISALNNQPEGSYTFKATTRVNYWHTSEVINGDFYISEAQTTTPEPTTTEAPTTTIEPSTTAEPTTEETTAITPSTVAPTVVPTTKDASVEKYNEQVKAAKDRITKIKKLSPKKHRKMLVKWKKVKGASGYQLLYSKNKKFKKAKKKIIKKAKIVKKTIKKLKAKKKYFFKIRTFDKIYNPITKKTEKVYGKWSKVKKKKTKK